MTLRFRIDPLAIIVAVVMALAFALLFQLNVVSVVVVLAVVGFAALGFRIEKSLAEQAIVAAIRDGA